MTGFREGLPKSQLELSFADIENKNLNIFISDNFDQEGGFFKRKLKDGTILTIENPTNEKVIIKNKGLTIEIEASCPLGDIYRTLIKQFPREFNLKNLDLS